MVKIDIKVLATVLRARKAEYKSSQKKYSQIYKTYNFNSTTWHYKSDTYALIIPTLNKMRSDKIKLQNMKEEFRTQHIVNSMFKGRSIQQIEPKTRNSEDYKCIRDRCYRRAEKMLSDFGKEWID